MSASSPASSRRPHRDTVKHVIVWLFLLVELFPLYMMLQVSFKDNGTFVRNPWFPAPPYVVVETSAAVDGGVVEKTRVAQWRELFGQPIPDHPKTLISITTRFDLSVYKTSNWTYGVKLIGPYIMNSVFVAVTGTIATMILALLAAYFFARYKMPFSGVLWTAFLVLMLLPSVANIVPLFTLLREMHLLNTLWALVIVGVAGAQVFNIFVLRNFIEDLPKDLFEAAEIDGASHLQQIINVMIPMSAPIIGTLSILVFLNKWNEFLLPLIVLRDQKLFTLGVGLIFLDGEHVKQWGQIMAAYFIAAIPLIVIFLFCMRLFVRGLSAGAIKG